MRIFLCIMTEKTLAKLCVWSKIQNKVDFSNVGCWVKKKGGFYEG